ncbi:hypothetical protein M5689_006637 [Euphorbia peplus]|nr:hypothetical protein M5689_006637 [Euphorbia peplus]
MMDRAINSLRYDVEISNLLEGKSSPLKKLLIFYLNEVFIHADNKKEFVVAVWSSKLRVISTFQDPEKDVDGLKFLFYWNQAQCTISNKTVLGMNKPLMFKDLERFWRVYKYYNASNTILIDDSTYKSNMNPEYTSVIPKSFDSRQIKDDYLDFEDGN